MIGPQRQWLAVYSWEFVTAQNAVLGLDQAVDLCRRCHKLAPSCLYNGNTFTAIIRDVVANLNLEPNQGLIIRSLAGHIVAGVASDEETEAFREFCACLGRDKP